MAFDWRQSPWGVEVSTEQELFSTIFNLGLLPNSCRYVWRGVNDASLRIRTTLQRSLVESDSLAPPSEREVRNRERQLLDAARRWGLNDIGLRNELALLAKLQHFGVPTRLLDVSVDPLVALWFACNSTLGKTGVLFAFDVTDLREIATLNFGWSTWHDVTYPNSGMLKSALSHSSTTHSPVLVTPIDEDDRMRAQGGRFLMGVNLSGRSATGVDAFDIELLEPLVDLYRLTDNSSTLSDPECEIPFLAICIPVEIQEHVREVLARNFIKSYETLFPDIAGFSKAIDSRSFELSDMPDLVDESNRDTYPEEIQRGLFPEEFEASD